MPRVKRTGRRLEKDKENSKNSCGMLIAYSNGKDIRCGKVMFGRIRRCLNCSLNLKTTENKNG